jgi:hypothetical protein
MFKKLIYCIALLLTLCAVAVTQDTKPQPERRNQFGDIGPTYRLDFTIRELDDQKLVNTRNYSMLINSSTQRGGSRANVQAVTKMPVVTSNKDGVPSTTYINVGLTLAAQLYETDGGYLLMMNAEIGGLAALGGEGMPSGSPTGNPLIRSVEMQTVSYLNLDKSQLLGSVDDVYSKHRFQLEVVAKKL